MLGSRTGSNTSAEAVSLCMQGINIAPQGVSIAPTGLNVAPQGASIGPTLIAIGPYDTTVAPQVRAHLHNSLSAHARPCQCMLWSYPLQPLLTCAVHFLKVLALVVTTLQAMCAAPAAVYCALQHVQWS